MAKLTAAIAARAPRRARRRARCRRRAAGPDPRGRRDPHRRAHAARGTGREHSRIRRSASSRALRVPLKFDGWDDPHGARPPLLGEHTESVLAERLGLSRERIAQLQGGKGDMTLTTVLYAVADGVATITLNRPESRNALNRAMCEELVAATARRGRRRRASGSCWCAATGRCSAPAPTSRSARA